MEGGVRSPKILLLQFNKKAQILFRATDTFDTFDDLALKPDKTDN